MGTKKTQYVIDDTDIAIVVIRLKVVVSALGLGEEQLKAAKDLVSAEVNHLKFRHIDQLQVAER